MLLNIQVRRHKVNQPLTPLKVGQVLDLFVAVAKELKRRGITRSTNNPVADLAELYFERGLKLTRATKSTKGFDATDEQGLKYEIKGRRLTPENPSRELSAIRGIEMAHFHFLAGVLFNENLTIMKACIVPHEVVSRYSTHVAHTNSRKFMLRDEVWSFPGVKDVTSELKAIEAAVRSA